jgi:hypothetical protein
MSRLLIVAAAAAVLTAPADAAPPRHGVLVPGESLGGVRLGDAAASVRARFGSFYGVCRGCSRQTWYFTYRGFTQQGVGVELRGGRVAAIFTLWSPTGWRSAGGLELGAPAQSLPPLGAIQCRGYRARVARAPGVVTAYYVLARKLWGFGLLRPGVAVCR